jgi:ankyrin repeat protein
MNYQDGCTSLIYAAMYDRIDCLRLLVQSGAAIEAKNLVRNMRYSVKKCCSCVRKAGWSISAALSSFYTLCRHFCIAVRACVDGFWLGVRGTDSCQTQDGFTALIGAAYRGRMKCVRLLLDAGADKDAQNNVCVICEILFSVDGSSAREKLFDCLSSCQL